jgi:hypothetical protein
MAAESLASHDAASSSTACFVASASSNYAFKAATFSFKTLTFSLTTANSFYLTPSNSAAAFLDATRGATFLKILLKMTILTDQEHNIIAAKF